MIKILDKFYFNRTVGWLFDINNLSNILIIKNFSLIFSLQLYFTIVTINFFNCIKNMY